MNPIKRQKSLIQIGFITKPYDYLNIIFCVLIIKKAVMSISLPFPLNNLQSHCKKMTDYLFIVFAWTSTYS